MTGTSVINAAIRQVLVLKKWESYSYWRRPENL
jgi:hypothetical protein